MLVPSFDVVHSVTQCGQVRVVAACVEVRGDSAIVEMCHIRIPIDFSARLLMAIGKDGPRDGSTSAEGGPEPRAATCRRLFAPSMASMARTGLERPRPSRGAEGGVDPARTRPALHSNVSRRAIPKLRLFGSHRMKSCELGHILEVGIERFDTGSAQVGPA